MPKDALLQHVSPWFITFEGGEGSGKSTIARWFTEQLTAHTPRNVVLTREPGAATAVGQKIRELVLSPDGEPLSPRTEALLFAADRAEHVHQVIRPALTRGDFVICDRYVDSSVAYQGAGRGLDSETIETVSMFATNELVPNWTVLLDIDPRIGLARRLSDGGADRLDLEAVTFHETVRAAFLTRAVAHLERFTVIDATPDLDMVKARVWAAFLHRATATGLPAPA